MLKVYNKGMKREGKPKTRKVNKMIKQKIVDYINSMNDDEVIELHNRYCEAAGCEDDRIYSMWDLDELLAGRTPVDILCMSFHGSFNPHHNFFWFNRCGNMESADYLGGTPVCAGDIADYILSAEDSLGNESIDFMLDRECNF